MRGFLPSRGRGDLTRRLRFVFVLAGLAAVSFLVGRTTSGDGGDEVHRSGERAPVAEKPLFWTCSMHPEVRLPRPGKCPKCFMDLVPVSATGSGEGGAPRLPLSPAARAVAGIETAPVERRAAHREVRLVGKITYDETRLAHVSGYVGGRIDRLYVDFTGTRVRRGDHLALVYSPDLRTAQEEYLLAARLVRDRGEAAERGREMDLLEAARKKLELWGILPEQVDAIGRTGATSDHTTIHAPIGGTVIDKRAFEGMYFETGERLFTIADLGSVWAQLDAYESDLPWIGYGREVAIETDSFPGEVFRGKVSFVEPFLQEETRTVRVRVNVPNAGERLKPGMFVRARLFARVDAAGRAIPAPPPGAFVCPMHPEVAGEEPGACSACGMDLVPAAELGLLAPTGEERDPVVIPATAPLLTGKRAVVYVEEGEGEEIAYAGREVRLGPRAGEAYVVLEGLAEGERVVVRGNFKIDAALQIRGVPSMMKPEGMPGVSESPPPDPVVPAPSTQGGDTVPDQALADVVRAYLALVRSLAEDDGEAAGSALASLRTVVDRTPGIGSLATALPVAGAELAAIREALPRITVPLLAAIGDRRLALEEPIVVAFCPMAAEGKGAEWIQEGREIRNPYFGEEMLRCGVIRRDLPSGAR